MALLESEELERGEGSDVRGRDSNVRVTHEKRYVSIGDLICGKYLVEGVLGVGGMAFVLSARHLELDQHFALKFLNADFLQEKGVVERFMREAKAACKIRNQHVAQVHDVGSHEGAPFLVMEHLTGKDLAAVLAEHGPPAILATAEFIVQACEALAVAHSHGIIHRDIKPENLFLVQHDGPPTLKLLDFGISTAALGDRCSTLTGRLMLGTPFYMSPEQVRSSAQADQRSDIWSLGAVLYELLTGALPFKGETVTELCAAVLETEPTPIQTLRRDVPDELCAIVSKCMAKNPADRWQNVAELAQALLPFAPGRSIASAERSSSIMKIPAAPLSSVNLPVTSFPPIATSTPSSALTPTSVTPQAVWQPTAQVPPSERSGLPKVTVLFSLAFAVLGTLSLYAARMMPRAPASVAPPAVAMTALNTASSPPESTELTNTGRMPPSIQTETLQRPVATATTQVPRLNVAGTIVKTRQPELARGIATPTSAASSGSAPLPAAASTPPTDSTHVELGY
jgi:eukaryotic-like serine/threonine-protein kinase